MQPFIVAEVSNTYLRGEPARPPERSLCGRFEQVIEFNRARGYALHTFAMNQYLADGGEQFVETIIAVFRHQPAPVAPPLTDRVTDRQSPHSGEPHARQADPTPA